MGTWFLGSAIGNTVAGLVGGHVRLAQGRRAAAPLPRHDADRRRRRRVHHAHRAPAARLDRRPQMSPPTTFADSPHWPLALRRHACWLPRCNGPPGAEPPPKIASDTPEVRRAGEQGPGRPQPRGQRRRLDPGHRHHGRHAVPERAASPIAPSSTTAARPAEAKAYDGQKLDALHRAFAEAAQARRERAGARRRRQARASSRRSTTELDAMYGEGKYCPPGDRQGGKEDRLQEPR